VNARRHPAAEYAVPFATVLCATGATLVLRPWMGGSASLLFFPAVILPGMYGGYGPAMLAALLATTSMAYFFVPPLYSFDIGIDDAIRLGVFAGVGATSAWLSARRRSAEDALLQSMRKLENNLKTLDSVSGWPMLIGPDAGASVRKLLTHAASVVGATAGAGPGHADSGIIDIESWKAWMLS